MSDRKLVVLGIPWDVETDGLKEYMSKFGEEMEDCIVMKEKFNELLNEEPEDVRSEESVKNKIFDQVMGPEKSGRVRTYGLGPTPSLVFGLSSGYTRVNHISMEETIRAFFFIVVRPFSKSLYRKINKVVAELLWLEVIWLFDWWANIKVELFTDSETLELMGKEHALLIPNHKSDIDWLVGWVLAQGSGCLGSSLALIKKSSKFLPVIGWSMWFSEYIFLERSWAKDETTLKKGLKNLNDFPHPFWLALFVEGTRFTQAKLVAAQEYATSMSLPVPRNVLIPRTKGFVSAVNHLRTFVPAIYNVSVAIPKTEPLPTMLRLLRGSSSTVHVHIKRHLMEELPTTDSGISQWCKDIFVEKDALLELHRMRDTFSDRQCHNIGRPKKSLFVVIVWSCLLISGMVKFFSLLPFSWGEIAFCAIFLLLVVILMQILILFSQSEYSTPPTPSPSSDTLKQQLLPK